ncbi:HAD family hydrolase [Planosporangium mesophilum]|uniref:Hydrolase n=1 Tax=Planosporangium mesophilum TaxID=689768 RepID=A0A8J3THB3_9ACTN|nr:HAD family hydrolase [Planosporangium mesophilum]NJC82503.1 HAD family hydrolase [Planosporangium mesophilum]GII25496.1 hydrolase [Planosporangium mesophilum]
MTTPIDHPLADRRALLLDFDGPVCAVFADYPAATAAAQLHAVIRDRLGHVPPDIASLTGHPLGILRRTADLGDDELTRAVADACRDAELTAVASAAPTPGAVDVLHAAHDSGCAVAIVSNNHADAIEKYLSAHDLLGYVGGIAGRTDGMDPRLLKPHPLLVTAGLATVNAQPADAVFVGDSETDIEAGRAAGVTTIGYANKPGKRERLADADLVVDSLTPLVDAIRRLAARP